MKHPMCALIALAVFLGFPLAAGGGEESKNKMIVFIAGPKDHGGPGAHEYEKDLALLKSCIDASPSLRGVGIQTRLYRGKVPKDIRELEGASTIVIHSSGDRSPREIHGLFPSNNGTANWYSEADVQYFQRLDGLMKRGLGIVVLHYSLIVKEPRTCEYLLDWIGGYHKEGQSQVKIDRSEAVPAAKGHAILRGVRPWTTDHEYYFNQYFREGDDRVVPILTSMLPSNDPKKHVIAWAVEREGGGRGFAFTGAHFHKNLQVEDNRRLLLNAILWTAKVPVPEGGVKCGAAESGWISLFNGKNLDGWKQINGKAKYTVEDGVIVGTSVPNSPNSFLCTEKHYGDFELEFEVMVDRALNSGVQIRSHSLPDYRKGRVHGYQVEIAVGGFSGGIYDEARRGRFLNKNKRTAEIRSLLKENAWNRYRVVCQGKRIQTWVNGVQVTDLEDDLTASGFIGLQVHGVGKRADPLRVRWRNLRLRELRQ